MMNMNMRESDEHLYPDVYNQFAPIADQLIRDMEKNHGDIYLNEDLLQQMIDEAINRVGADIPVSDGMATEEAVPTIYQYGRGRPHGGYNHGHWRNYNRGALSDIFRILFLQQIFGRRRPCWRCR